VVGIFALASKKGVELLIVLVLEGLDEVVFGFSCGGVDLVRIGVVRGLVGIWHRLVPFLVASLILVDVGGEGGPITVTRSFGIIGASLTGEVFGLGGPQDILQGMQLEALGCS